MSGLIKKRAEIVGLINEARERTDMMLSQLDALGSGPVKTLVEAVIG